MTKRNRKAKQEDVPYSSPDMTPAATRLTPMTASDAVHPAQAPLHHQTRGSFRQDRRFAANDPQSGRKRPIDMLCSPPDQVLDIGLIHTIAVVGRVVKADTTPNLPGS
jgi:hypothetical protein